MIVSSGTQLRTVYIREFHEEVWKITNHIDDDSGVEIAKNV